MDKRNLVLGLALAGLISAGTTLKTSTAQADNHGGDAKAAEGKHNCGGKESCAGKDKKADKKKAKKGAVVPAAAGATETKDANGCNGKDGCGGKAEEKKSEEKH